MTRTADELYRALLTDTWPAGAACRIDFGLDADQATSEARYAALQRAVAGGATVAQLHAAANDASALNRLVNHTADFAGMQGNLTCPEATMRTRQEMHDAIQNATRAGVNELLRTIIDHLRWDAEEGCYDANKEVGGAETVDLLNRELDNLGLLPEIQPGGPLRSDSD